MLVLITYHIIILVPCSPAVLASTPSGRCPLPATPKAGGGGSPPERIVCDLAVRTQVRDEESETRFQPASIKQLVNLRQHTSTPMSKIRPQTYLNSCLPRYRYRYTEQPQNPGLNLSNIMQDYGGRAFISTSRQHAPHRVPVN